MSLAGYVREVCVLVCVCVCRPCLPRKSLSAFLFLCRSLERAARDEGVWRTVGEPAGWYSKPRERMMVGDK